MSFELACCLLATVAALYYIFFPSSFSVGRKKTRVSYLRERKDVVYENLRDLNFEFKAGKMPETDYQSLTIVTARRSRHPSCRNRPARSQSRRRTQKSEIMKDQICKSSNPLSS